MNGEGKDCYTKPIPPAEFSELARNVRATCVRLEPEAGYALDENTVTQLKASIQKLVAGGLLRPEHGVLVQEHLKQHPLRWMDFTSA